MLKSLSTQFAATLFFGPIGLVYTSVATAVFMSLVLAVLLFSELGVLSFLLMWPISIVAGLVFVKLHNDQIRSSGSKLLLSPGDEPGYVSSISSWVRGAAVLSLVLIAGYVLFLYLPGHKQDGNKLGRIVQSTDAPITESAQQTAGNEAGQTDTTVIPANAANNSDADGNNDNFAVISLPQREVATVIIDSDGNVQQGDSDSALNSGNPELTVTASLVNLRRGPGTNFGIVTQLQEGVKLFEFARDGKWINVEAANSGVSGWIYGELVSSDISRN